MANTRLVAVFVVAALLLVSPGASATSVEELFQQFHMFGTWAADCNEPATPQNPRVSITMPSAGLVLEDHNLGADFAVNHYSILSAEQLSATGLSVEVIFQPGTTDEERQKLIFAVRNNTRRTLFNQTDSGTVRVKDGIALARGSKTPLLRKCDDGSVTH
ncbi:MAG TPA: hypothetical protein VKG24_19785 [Pseudolabrys sp.]|jgi:hypothetical protein|nr:hypothetical protein [Pseudolabrys sp.]